MIVTAGCVTVAVVVVTLRDVVVVETVVLGPDETMTVTIGTVPVAVVTSVLGESVVVMGCREDVLEAGIVLPDWVIVDAI